MKRLILLSGCAMATMAIVAQTTPAIYPDAPFNHVSPNGLYAASETSIFFNFKNNETYAYSEQYNIGNGNSISDTGIFTGYKVGEEIAYYWKNGFWTKLPVAPGTTGSYANGITPDGSMIVGEVSPEGYTGDYEGKMLMPCYWEMQADGSYSLPQFLPHPQADFTGRSPQYVTAVRVSADGNVIAGQMRDFSGYINQPIIYTRDDKGEWSYTMVLNELFYPNGVVLPPDPGEAPTQQDFMTPEEIVAFDQALALWELLGGDYDNYPDIWNYMTQDELDAYNEAAMEWNSLSEAYYIALGELYVTVPNFSYNNVITNSDCTMYVSTDTKGFYDEFTGQTFQNNVIYAVNLKDGSYVTYPPVDDIHLIATSMADDGTIFAQHHDYDYGIYNGYVLPAGASEFQTLYSYVSQVNPELGEWMKENMTHDYIAIDTSDWTEYTATTLATGVPYTTPDLGLIVMAQSNFWDYDSPYNTFGYLISPWGLSGVESLVEDAQTLTVVSLPGGDIAIKGAAATLEIYALNGQKVLSVANPGNMVSTSLPKGLYVAKVADAAGEAVTKKIIIK